ncbi:unnamed protein product, partial [Prorocentrum cordatum]
METTCAQCPGSDIHDLVYCVPDGAISSITRRATSTSLPMVCPARNRRLRSPAHGGGVPGEPGRRSLSATLATLPRPWLLALRRDLALRPLEDALLGLRSCGSEAE